MLGIVLAHMHLCALLMSMYMEQKREIGNIGILHLSFQDCFKDETVTHKRFFF